MDDIHNGWLEAKRQILIHGNKNKTLYDDKYSRPPVVYKEGEEVRLKQPQTKVGLKKKLRNDNWSEPRTITKVINDQNIEIGGKKWFT